MISWTAIENALVAEALAASGLAEGRVILGDQTAAKPPTGEYAVIRLGGVTTVGRDQEGPVNDEGILEIIGNREITVEVHGFRARAREIVESIVTAMQKTSVVDRLAVAGIAVIDVSAARNVTVPEGETYVQHWECEVFVRVASSDEDDVGFIESVEMERTTISPPASDVMDTFIIPEPTP